jgi:hypothetical protein
MPLFTTLQSSTPSRLAINAADRHIEDAATATAAALKCVPGAYNIVARRRPGCPKPRRPPLSVPMQCITQLGCANDKAKLELQFRPRPLEWLSRAQPPPEDRLSEAIS